MTNVPICIVCHGTAEMHPGPCPRCGAIVCVARGGECFEDHGTACLVASFEELHPGVTLPYTCHHCGRRAPLEATVRQSELMDQWLASVPAGAAKVIAHLGVMFCPAPACAAAADTYHQSLLAKFGPAPF